MADISLSYNNNRIIKIQLEQIKALETNFSKLIWLLFLAQADSLQSLYVYQFNISQYLMTANNN